MAKIVLGLGTSHSPMLSTPAEIWHLHADRDQKNRALESSGGEPTITKTSNRAERGRNWNNIWVMKFGSLNKRAANKRSWR